MPRGGKRTGTPGALYSNRQDLQQGARSMPVAAATGQAYGVAGEQLAAQKVLPMAGTPLPPMPAGQPDVSPAAPPPTMPADIPSLGDPTARPDEHVMTGAPIGPGAGAVLPLPTQMTTARDFLAGALSAGPPGANPEVQYLLSQLQSRGL